MGTGVWNESEIMGQSPADYRTVDGTGLRGPMTLNWIGGWKFDGRIDVNPDLTSHLINFMTLLHEITTLL